MPVCAFRFFLPCSARSSVFLLSEVNISMLCPLKHLQCQQLQRKTGVQVTACKCILPRVKRRRTVCRKFLCPTHRILLLNSPIKCTRVRCYRPRPSPLLPSRRRSSDPHHLHRNWSFRRWWPSRHAMISLVVYLL